MTFKERIKELFLFMSLFKTFLDMKTSFYKHESFVVNG